MIKLKDILTEAKGDCYQAAGRLIMNFMGDKKHKLVHGMVNGQGALKGIRFGHAWVEYGSKVMDHSNGKKQEMPKALYYAVGDVRPRECKYYTGDEAAKWMLKSKHWGPWQMSGDTIKLVQEDIPDIRGEIGKKRLRVPSSILDKLDEGTCGYGKNGKLGETPAGPHLIDDADLQSKLSRGHKPDWAQLHTSKFLPFDEVEENFKDGKKKGKSRPGRVKKSGASCNGSVTSLRAKAKKYGGEKGKMYHWCANMKKGKKK